MKKQFFHLIILLFASTILLSACNLPGNPATQEPAAIYTQAAKTIVARLTQGVPITTQLPTAPPHPTDTLAPTSTLLPTSTPLPSVTPLPSLTPIPPATATLLPTATPIPCNRAKFVDETIPDSTIFNPGATFEKIWTLKNTGSCTWTTKYSLTFVKGDEMGGESVKIGERVNPGETVDVAVTLTAPGAEGTYQGFWMLKSDGGGRFGIGDDAGKAFWVKIKVVAPKKGIVYSFVDNYCSATWQSSSGKLKCPGNGTEPSGFVIRLPEPDLENRHENEPALWTNPPTTKDSWISGTYPGFKIKAGDLFRADIGCLVDSPKCDVIFQLNYKIGNGPLKTLDEWHEVYDGNITSVEIDLSALAGKSVQFILTVLTNGPYKDDAAFWLMPQIYRPAP